MTIDEKYVKKYFPDAAFYNTASTSEPDYMIFMLTPNDGFSYSLIKGPLSNRKRWSIARKIMDKQMLDKLAN